MRILVRHLFIMGSLHAHGLSEPILRRSHLIDIDFDIGWFDSPAVENRFRASALPLLTGAATPSQQNLAGKTGDYEKHKISGESGSWYSRGGIR